MLPTLVVGCTSEAVWSRQCVTTTASGVDNAASRLANFAERGLFHPQREADHYAKATEGTQKYINEQCR